MAEENTKKSYLAIICGLSVVVFLLAVTVGILVMRKHNSPANTELQKDSASSEEQEKNDAVSSEDREYNDVLLTGESLAPYLAILGTESGRNDVFKVSQDFIDGLNSVYVMGHTGTVEHGFTTHSEYTIDVMEWVDNSYASREEFESFINCLCGYFGKEGAIKSYDSISDETYLWIDDQHNAYALCWYENGIINMRWDYKKTPIQKVNRCIRCGTEIGSGSSFCVSCLATPIDQIGSPAKKNEQAKPAQHTCEVSGCYQVGEYDIVGFSGKTEYYCRKHMLEMGEIVNDILFSNKYGTPTTVCAHKGCTNYIASSGNTNCCEKHARKCLSCGSYIDEDALYCIPCIAKALY